MFNFLGRVFGSEKAMERAVDGVVSGLDKLVYTGEERAEQHAKDVSEARHMVIGWMDRTQGQNIARRFLAVIITFVWLIQYLAAIVFSMAVVWAEDAATQLRLRESADLVGGYADGMTGAMMLILGFYFAAPHLSAIIGPAMSRFQKTATVFSPGQETPSLASRATQT